MADEEVGGRPPDDVSKASLAIMQRVSAQPNLPGRTGSEALDGEVLPPKDRVAKADPASGEPEEVADPSGEEEEQEDDEYIDPDTNTDEAEEEPREEEEAEEDDSDPEIEVTVDGETAKVKLSELKNTYSGEKAIEKRLQQATELRNGYYEYGTALYKGLQLQAEKLKQLDSVLVTVADPQIDWEKLRIQDPNKYLLERDKQRDAQEKRSAIQKEQDRIAAEQKGLLDKEREVRAADEARILTQKLPILRDPKKGKEIMAGMITGSQAYGFQPQEIAEVIDHRMLLVLHDAVKYRKLVAMKEAKLKGKGKPGAPPSQGSVKTLLRPGGNPGFSKKMAAAKQSKANVEQARKTGEVEDVARLLIQPVRRK